MRIKSRHLVAVARLGLGAAALAGLTFALGPFGDIEKSLPVSDTVLHMISFYLLGVMGVLAYPRVRRGDIMTILVLAGGGLEVMQGLVGRDCSFGDWMADAVGVGALALPATLERIRDATRQRTSEDLLTTLGSMERRKPRTGATARTSLPDVLAQQA